MRDRLYPTDTTDEQWELIGPVIAARKAQHPSVSGHDPATSSDPTGEMLITVGGCEGSVQACTGGDPGSGGSSTDSGGDNGNGSGSSSNQGQRTGIYSIDKEKYQIRQAQNLLSGLAEFPILLSMQPYLTRNDGPEMRVDGCLDPQSANSQDCQNGPDYTTVNATVCVDVIPVCGALAFTQTKDGKLYCTPSFGVGEGDSISVQQGVYLGPGDQNDLDNFIQGPGLTASACGGETVGLCATLVDGQPSLFPWDPGFTNAFGVEGSVAGNLHGSSTTYFSSVTGASASVTYGYSADCTSWPSTIVGTMASIWSWVARL